MLELKIYHHSWQNEQEQFLHKGIKWFVCFTSYLASLIRTLFEESQVAATVFPRFWGQEALTEVCSGISTQSKTCTKAPTALAIGEAVSVVCYRKCIHYYLVTKEALVRSKATDPNLGEFVSRE